MHEGPVRVGGDDASVAQLRPPYLARALIMLALCIAWCIYRRRKKRAGYNASAKNYTPYGQELGTI